MRPCSLCPSILPLILSTAVFGQNGDRTGETQGGLPAEWRVAAAPVRSAAEELGTFDVAAGFEIQLVASEPLVEAPVAISFGADGRMWVVEMPGYMRTADGAGETEPIGRIKVLDDTDGDGVMDKAQVFLDRLVMPRGVAQWRDGLLVIEPPHLLFCRDTDGDGRSDESRIVASGFAGRDNPEHAGNGLLYTLDNTFTCSQHPERFVPSGDSIACERVPPHGQWGISEDALGRLYYSPNSDPLLVDLLPKHYAARNPNQHSFEGVPSRAATDTRVFPSHLTPGVNRGYQKGVLKDGRLANFTGACSPLVYEGSLLGAMKGHALVCEVAGNLVHRYRIDERDGRIEASPADGDRSFWTSSDERFRPVFATTGTDGAVYVADMYRGIIQHRNFMTTFLRTQVDDRGLAQPLDAGRIWRIVPKGVRAPRAADLARSSAADLASALASTDKPVRTIARRLIIERRDSTTLAAVRDALASELPVEIALEHLWTLAGAREMDRATLDRAAASASAVVRVHAIRIAETILPQPALARVVARAGEDPDPAVRVQAALSSGRLDPPLRMAVLEPLLRMDIASRQMRSAIMSAVAGAEHEMLDSVLAGVVLDSDSVAARAFASELTDMLLEDGDDLRAGQPSPTMLRATIESISSVAAGRPWLARVMLERIAARQRLNSKEPVQLIASARPSGWWEMLDANRSDLQIAVSIDRNIFWPGRADVAFVPPKVARSETMTLQDYGKRLYSNCMSCHQANGRGLPPVYPPLRASPIVMGDPSVLVRIVMHGLEGRVEVDGQVYNQVMPAAPVRSDEEIAAVLTYVRSAWGNNSEPIDPAFVARVRDETKGRNRPFTTRELGIEAR